MPGRQSILSGLLILLVLLTLCQCRSADRAVNQASTRSSSEQSVPSDITERLKTEAGDQIAWVGLSREQLSNYYGFSGDLLLDFSVLVSDSDELSNEIAVFSPKDADARLSVLEGINQHLTTIAATFRDLNKTEYKKIQNRLIMELDGMVILTVMDNTALYYNTLKELGAQEINE